MTVRYEQRVVLKEASLEKVNKYRPLQRLLIQEFDRPVKIHELPLGACGTWCPSASAALDALGIKDRSVRRVLSRTAIICTPNILRD